MTSDPAKRGKGRPRMLADMPEEAVSTRLTGRQLLLGGLDPDEVAAALAVAARSVIARAAWQCSSTLFAMKADPKAARDFERRIIAQMEGCLARAGFDTARKEEALDAFCALLEVHMQLCEIDR
jgi:hypothetical protein